MEILTERELLMRKREIIKKIKEGAVFIYPTDTIYGIGCDATNEDSVKKIRELKNRPEMPLSIWIPSIEWAKDNFEISEKGEEYINQLPGPFTIVMELKNKNAVARSVNPKDDSLGVRLPNHRLRKIFEEIGIPIITTSVNKSKESFMTNLDNLDKDFKKSVDFLIYEGEKRNKPSKIIDLVHDKVVER